MAKILVVDDSAVYRKELVVLLSSDGHLTSEAADGLDALIVARNERPDVVISDILMPSMDGFALVRALREDPSLSATRVIFCTANYNEQETQKLAKTCQVGCVLMKPCDPEAVLKAVDQVLAGVPESSTMRDQEFEQDHLFLLTNKLTETSNALNAANARLSALVDLNLQLATAEDAQILLQGMCAGARSLLGSRYAVLAVIDERAELSRFTTSGIDFGNQTPPPPVVTAGPLSELLMTGHPWRARARKSGDIFSGLPSGYPPASAYLAVRLDIGAHALGWLCVAEKIGANGFDARDERLLSSVGSLASRLYEARSPQI